MHCDILNTNKPFHVVLLKYFCPLAAAAAAAAKSLQGISGLHSRRTRGDRHSPRVEAKKPALLSSRDGYLWELTGWTQGSQAS